ncbi:MAG: hypothetical protein U0271_13325 [Polyangiaceae bacterium]
MAGKIRQMIDKIVRERSRGDEVLVITTKTKLLHKGIDCNAYNAASPDDPKIIAALQQVALDLKVAL